MVFLIKAVYNHLDWLFSRTYFSVLASLIFHAISHSILAFLTFHAISHSVPLIAQNIFWSMNEFVKELFKNLCFACLTSSDFVAKSIILFSWESFFQLHYCVTSNLVQTVHCFLLLLIYLFTYLFIYLFNYLFFGSATIKC